ncbi:MAG: glycosyltransferase family 4 protein [Asgard group archaeon]|nr:glycosyltransferase family 4 protein [Asgard group archaeon]
MTMKKLVIYSTPKSPHTTGLVQFLTSKWKTYLLCESTEKNIPDDILSLYKNYSDELTLRADHEFIINAKKYVFKHPLISLLDLIRAKNQFRDIISYRRKAESISKILLDINPSLIYSHQLHAGISTYLSGFKPYVLAFWGTDVYQYVKEFNYSSLVAECLNSAKLIQTVNDEQKEILLDLFNINPDKIFVQNFGAKVKDFAYLKDKSNLREKYGFKEKYLILSARYNQNKEVFRLDLIIKAFKLLLDKTGLDARLIFINKAHTRTELKELTKELGIEDKVTFMGFLAGDQYREIISLVDLFVQCPLYDSVGISVMESLAAGVPVITTIVDGAKITIKDSFNGIFLESRKPEEIAEKIELLLKNPDKLKTMGKNAHEWAIKNCDRSIAMKNINAQLNSVVD